jgi:hypothetical protein
MNKLVISAVLILLQQDALAASGKCVYSYDARTRTINKHCEGQSYGFNLTKEESASLSSGRARTCTVERISHTKDRRSNRRECR